MCTQISRRRRPCTGRSWQSEPKLAEQWLAAHHFPEFPASSDVVQTLPNNCPEVAEHLPRVPRFRPESTNAGRLRMMLANLGQTMSKHDQDGPMLAQCRPNLGPMWPNMGHDLGNIGQCWSTSARCLTTLAGIDRFWTKLGTSCPKFGQRHFRRPGAILRQLWGTFSAISGQLRSSPGATLRDVCRRIVWQSSGNCIISAITGCCKAGHISELSEADCGQSVCACRCIIFCVSDPLRRSRRDPRLCWPPGCTQARVQLAGRWHRLVGVGGRMADRTVGRGGWCLTADSAVTTHTPTSCVAWLPRPCPAREGWRRSWGERPAATGAGDPTRARPQRALHWRAPTRVGSPHVPKNVGKIHPHAEPAASERRPNFCESVTGGGDVPAAR